MEFFKIVAEVSWLLRHRKRISYAALAQAYGFDEAGLEALRIELIQVEQVALDQNGQFLIWSDAESLTPPPGNVDLPPVRPFRSRHDADVVPASTEIDSSASAALPAQGSATPDVAQANSDLPAGAERRQLTVMFCDLVGSTELSTRLDPEDLQDIIRSYQAAATEVVREFDGFVAKYMGDGILVYFGYPHATEHNAEAAVKTALGIVQAVPALNENLDPALDIEIAVRIGIATGMVVVGEVMGEGEAKERSVVGETPNLAARLQDLAQTNGIIVSDVTRDIAGDLFIYRDTGDHELKGISAPAKAWEVLGERSAEEDDTAEWAPPMLPLVGREEVLGLLTRAWDGSLEGLGNVVLLQGEAGIGKARLLAALRDQIKDPDYALVRIQSSPYHTASILFPVIAYLKGAMHWKSGDNAQLRFEKLVSYLEQYTYPSEEAVPLFAALLSLPLADSRFAQLRMTATQQRDATLDAIAAIFLELAEQRPLLMLWEDLHWADPTTVELLSLLIDQVPTSPVLVIATYRPEFVAPWPARSHITPITLNRMERTEVEMIATNIGGGKTMPPEVLDHIVARADGVPLYVEELTRTIKEAGILQETQDRYELTGVLADMHIPETLQDSLMARLDRAPLLREVAQIAAVIGRDFSYEMIAALAPLEAAELQQGLAQLVESELVYQRGRGERAVYVFKHALIHDAAYGSLLKRSRQKYHGQLAQLLEERYGSYIEDHPEIAAYHHAEAGNASQAIAYLRIAGRKAAETFAHQEATTHYSNALKLASSLPDDPDRAQLEMELCVEIGPSIGSVKGFACPEYGQAYSRARDLCEQLNEDKFLAPILRGLTFYNLVCGETRKAVTIATEFLHLAEQQQDEEAGMYGNYSVGNCLMCHGEIALADEHLATAVHSYQPDKHDALALVYGIDVGVAAQGNEALCLWMLGRADEALNRAKAALTLAQQHEHPFSLTFAWTWMAIVHQFRSEPAAVAEHARQAMEIARTNRIPMFLGYSTTVYGWALSAQGEHLAGIKTLHEGLRQLSVIGVRYFHTYFTGLLVESLLASGRLRLALQYLNNEIAQNPQERFWLPELHRLLGEIQQRQGAAAETIDVHFREALKMAQAQQMKSLELRAAVSIARLSQQQGKKDIAQTLLAPIYSSFAEGFETSDLLAAKALLDEVA